MVKNRFKKKRYRFPIDYFCHYNPLKWFISSHIHPNDSFSEFWLSFWQNFPTLIFQFIWPQLTPKLTLGSVYNSERITRQCPSSSFTNKQIQFQFDQEKILSVVTERHGEEIHSVGPIVRPDSGRQSPQLGRWHFFGVKIRVSWNSRWVKFSKNFEKFHPTNANFQTKNACWGWNFYPKILSLFG